MVEPAKCALLLSSTNVQRCCFRNTLTEGIAADWRRARTIRLKPPPMTR